MYLFEPEIKMPHTDFNLFRSCNNADRNWVYKQEFYQVKNELLEMYGDFAGYDKQEIERTCNSCNGTGVHVWGGTNSRCNRCYNGIYETRVYYLKRYVLNGQLFHRPVERAEGQIIEVIKGRVNHVAPEIAPGFAYACILKKYKPDMFKDHLRRFRQTFSRSDMKKWGDIAASNSDIISALASWYKVEGEDLPF